VIKQPINLFARGKKEKRKKAVATAKYSGEIKTEY
jgi:hypothetical protein